MHDSDRRKIVEEHLGIYLYHQISTTDNHQQPFLIGLQELLEFLKSELKFKNAKDLDTCVWKLCNSFARMCSVNHKLFYEIRPKKKANHTWLSPRPLLDNPITIGQKICAAIAAGADALAFKLLEESNIIDTYSKDFGGPLQMALYGDNYTLITTLLEYYSGELSADSDQLHGAITVAIEVGKVGVQESLLKHFKGWPEHHYFLWYAGAVKRGSTRAIDALLHTKFKTDVISRILDEILIMCMLGTESLINHYIKNRQILQGQEDYSASTPLIVAVSAENIRMARYIITTGVDVNQCHGITGDSALCIAAERVDHGMVRLLLNNGATLDMGLWEPDAIAMRRLTKVFD